jgi:hypothetical protein
MLMATKKIVRGYGITIPVRVIEQRTDEPDAPKDISTATEIKACLESTTLTLGSGTTITSGPRGEFDVQFTDVQTAALTTGKKTIKGQIELPPLDYNISVNITDENC